MLRLLLTALIFCLFSLNEASAQPRRTLHDAGAAGRLVAAPAGMGEALRLQRAGQTVWQARDQRFEPFRDGAPIPIGGGQTAIGITGWTGGAYCCWTLHLFRPGPQGLTHVASLPLGKREPDVLRLAPPGTQGIVLADAEFDFWEAPASRAANLHPAVPLRWTGRALEADQAAMRRPVAAALGHACLETAAPEGVPPPEQRITAHPSPEAAIAALRAMDWTVRGGPAAHPGVEAARLAACLVYSGHAAEARRLLREAWPAGAPGLPETERQLAARLACSPFAAAVRAINPPGAPYLGARCNRNGADRTAVFGLDWR
ncbi:hypothetical protein J5Y09_03225 [Roseomonas sp. PWR1]|uniref:Uncharacterized protein n=1 Tax=Roseomonas nitratireducens TaxID=2820810 RepID=A0ABS4AQR9_9PROT|nr:hypothetical protein [Neoroseomonas nitratireducens]MBP0462912.1 hypothetical protein [Neoroseomonas nitratireducens]